MRFMEDRLPRLHHVITRQGSQVPVHAALLTAQLLSGMYYVITRVALVNGMNRIVLSLYRDIVALTILIPACYFIDKGRRPKLSLSVVGTLFLLGLTGIYGSQYLLFVGIGFTSAEFSSAMQPSVPVFTAIIAIVFGVELVNWYRRDGQAKVIGITLCCGGAILITFYQGPAVIQYHDSEGVSVTVPDVSLDGIRIVAMVAAWGFKITGWQFGALCLIGNCLCMATYINLQAPLLKKYPAPASVTAYAYTFGAILMGITGIFAINDSSAWALSFDLNLVAVLYNGVIASAFNFALMTWCLTRVGPLFVASYIPIQSIAAAVLALIFLGSTLYLGSILGFVLILSGLLLVSWAREETIRFATIASHIESYHPVQFSAEIDEFDGIREPLIQVGR